jgi:hypothetical protein
MRGLLFSEREADDMGRDTDAGPPQRRGGQACSRGSHVASRSVVRTSSRGSTRCIGRTSGAAPQTGLGHHRRRSRAPRGGRARRTCRGAGSNEATSLRACGLSDTSRCRDGATLHPKWRNDKHLLAHGCHVLSRYPTYRVEPPGIESVVRVSESGSGGGPQRSTLRHTRARPGGTSILL